MPIQSDSSPLLAAACRAVREGDWDGAARLTAQLRREEIPAAVDDFRRYREDLESVLRAARTARLELGALLARTRAAHGFIRQGFAVSPGS